MQKAGFNAAKKTNEFSLEGILIVNENLEIKYIDEHLSNVLGFYDGEIKFNYFSNTSSEFRSCLNRCSNEKIPINFRQYIRESVKWFKCYATLYGNDFIIHFSDLSYLTDLENKFLTLLESTADFNVLIGLDYQIESFNKSSEIFVQDVLKKNLKNGDLIFEFLPISEHEDFKRDFESACRGNFFTYNKKVLYGDRICWFKLTFMPYYFQDSDEVIGVSFNSVDITKLVHSQEIIAEKEGIINEIFNISSESYLYISKDLKIIYKNDAVDLIYPSFFGAIPKIGENALLFIKNEKLNEFKEFYERVLNGATIQFHRNEGGIFWRILLFPVYNNLGILIGIANRIQDITTQKLNEKK